MRLHSDRIWPVRSRIGLLVTLSFLMIWGSGCKTPDFIGKPYGNFTAYYNTFYNAEQQFEAGYKNLGRQNQDIDRERYLPLFVKTTGASASLEFEQTVLKSADLLREHPDSKWVDDALLLIGKSYFYQENYVGATLKFREVIDLGTQLREEGHFWLARSLITSGALDLAEEQMDLARNLPDVNRKWASQYELLLAELYIKQENWELAADFLTSAIGDIKSKDLAGRAQFLLGQISEKLGRYETAMSAYESVRKYHPVYEMDYAARYSAIRVDGLHLDPDRALGDVRKMERDDKHLSTLSELRYLRARILQEIGRDDEAFDIYDELLYDPVESLRASAVKGRIHYALGEMYRDIDLDYVMAAAHFDTAAASLTSAVSARNSSRVGSAPGASSQYAPEAITDAGDMKDNYSSFARVYKDIARYDSLLWMGSLPQEEYDAKILVMREQRAEVLKEQRRILEERQREQAFRSGSNSDAFLNRGLPDGKIIPTLDDPTGQAGGFLFHEDPIRSQEGRIAFQNIWGTRQLAPNWRRSAVLAAAGMEARTEEAEEELAQLEDLGEDELPEIDDSAVPRDSLAQVEMRGSRAISRYELGNIMFLGMATPDSAAIWYRLVIDEDGEEEVAQRAYYALAEVHRALGDSLAANRLYRDILDRFPESDFSNGVRERLGIEADASVAADSTLLAKNAFQALLNARESDSLAVITLNNFLGFASDWEGFEESTLALFAVGDIHLENAGADSAAIFEALPLTVGRHRLAGLWPNKFKPLPDSTIALPDSLLAMADSLTIGADSLVVGADSLGMPTDSLSISPDSLSGITPEMSDSLLVASDSTLVAPDSTLVSPDSTLVSPDSTLAAQDSTLVSPDLTLAPDSTLAIPDSTQGVDAELLAIEEEPVLENLYIEDIYSKIMSLGKGKKVAMQAEGILAALVELRTPPPDTTSADSLGLDALATDSLAVDSLAMASLPIDAAANDSLAVDSLAVDSLATDSVATDSLAGELLPQKSLSGGQPVVDSLGVSSQVMSDSLVLALVARSAAVQDSLAAAADSLARLGLTRTVPRAREPVNLESEEEGEEEGRASSNLKPLLPTGRPNIDAEGHSVILGTHFDLSSAQVHLRDLAVHTDSTEIPLYVITQAEGDRLEFLVGWGMFTSREERDDAMARFDAYLPERRNHLHLLPTTIRRR